MIEVQRRALGPLAASVLLLLAAFAFQHLGGLAPCPLCIWQRWPHAVAIALGLLILAWPSRGLAALAGLAMLAGAGIGVYHVGIERDWWAGPASCTAPAPGAAAPGELLDQILATPVVLCDEVAWSWLGISMAGWNAVLSLAIALLWVRAALARDGASHRL
jgi:disulfide bond formation protein DsbB